MNRGIGLAVLCLVGLGLMGCQQPKRVIGGVRRDNLGARIVSLAPSASDIIGMAMQHERLLGVTDSCPSVVSKGRPVVVRNTKIDYEKIAELKPGIILYDSSLYSDLDREKLSQTGAEMIDLHVTSMDSLEESLYKMSNRVGIEIPISEYMDRIYTVKERFVLSEGEEPMPAAILMGGGGEYMAAGTKSFQADLVAWAGGKVVGPESDRFAAINVESLVAMNPEIIFSPGQAAQILADPRLQTIRAVKEKKVFDVKEDHLLRTGSQLDLVLDAMGTAISNIRINRKNQGS